jgi:hypothetical protein
VDLWVRVGGTPFPHIHSTTYRIHITYRTRPVHGVHSCEILDLPVLELDPLNIHLFSFLIFHQPKGCFPPDRQKVPEFTLKKTLFFFKKGYESVNFRLRRTRPEIRRPWTCSRSHTYMQNLDTQIYLLWP